MTRPLELLVFVAAVALAGGPAAQAEVQADDTLVATPQFVADCEALTRHPHRLAGTREARDAVDYIEKRLSEIGPDRIVVEEFLTPQTAVKRCVLELVIPEREPDSGTKRELRLLPVRPNGVIPPVAPPEGVSGEIVHAGAGRPEDFKVSPKGRIVVLDHNCDRGWLKAFALGAKAVVFVPPERPVELHNAWQSLHVVANANLLRFYYPGKKEDLPEGAAATIHSEVVWESVTGRNVFALLHGTAPVFHLKHQELIVVATHLDSFGEVPRASPGARGAANCAGLLKTVEYLKVNRPRRHMLFAFFDAQARGHSGSSAFYRTLEDDESEPVHVEQRQKYLENEKSFLVAMREILAEEEPWRTEHDDRKRFIMRLKDKAASHVDDVMELLEPLGRKFKAVKRGTPEAAPLEAVERELRAEKKAWNDLRRALAKEYVPSVEELARLRRAAGEEGDPVERQALLVEVREGEEVRARMSVVLREVREDVAVRTAELEIEESALRSDRRVKELVGDTWIGLHCSFVFGDVSPRWGLIIGGDSSLHSNTDNAGFYSGIQRSFLAAFDSVDGRTETEQGRGGRHASRLAHFVRDTADGSLSSPRVASAAPFLVHSGEVAGRFGIYNLVLGTCQEGLWREGTPDDTLDRLDLDLIETQVTEAAILLGEVANEDGLSLRRAIIEDKQHLFPEFRTDKRVHGPMVMGKSPGSSLPNNPMGGAIVRLNLLRGWGGLPRDYHSPKPYAFDDFLICRTNHNGSYFLGPVPGARGIRLARGFAISFDDRGAAEYASDLGSVRRVTERLNVYKCRHGVVVLPPQLNVEETEVLGARADFRLEDEKSYHVTEDGVVYWYCERKIAGIKLFGRDSVVGLVSGDARLEGRTKEVEKPTGEGFPLERTWELPNSASQSAADMWRLNESRMKVLRARGVIDSSVQELHGRAEDLMLEAQETQDRDPTRVGESDALAASSFMLERSVYTKTRQSLDDLVRAVLVLLALSVPFAYSLERLLIGSTSIYRQIGWFAALFVATFLTLFFSHPAFAISKAPMIIFLGFAVLVLSSLVIVIIMRKFETEIKVLQGLTSTVHVADVSRFSTIIAAMTMGISTMRRRPLRTALTAVTIILLTFTILCFASFGKRTGIVKFFLLPPPGYAGVQIHRVNWRELGPEVLDVLKGRWSGDVSICSRYWVSPDDRREYGVLIACEDGSKPTALRGVLGLEGEEIAQREDLARLLLGLEADETRRREDRARHLREKAPHFTETVWMTEAVAARLEVEAGSRVLVGGVRLRVGKLLSPSDVAGIQDMDGSYILPVDFQEMKSVKAEETLDESALLSRQDWAALPTDSAVIVSADVAKRMGATLRAVTLYTQDAGAATAIGEEIARILPVPVVSTRSDGVYRQILGSVIEAGGARDLLFPILLGGLVIFGTMLGSVADREREIYSFSALGLAPPHVAGLFFAEAMVYSVLGGLGGYLLAQASMKILRYLAGFGLVRVPEMNYSSTNAIVTLLIVMATVLVSAIYPAIRASRSANPGILRTWRLPLPEGDVFDIAFPFTVSEYDITGVVSFLKEHFDNFTDTSLGVFMSKGARLARGEASAIGLDSELALAPFDLGVTQEFELRSAPSEIKGIDEVKIKITRKSGQPKDWQRLNKVLLDDLRRQFLIWRALPPETMEIYRQRTLTALGAREPAADTRRTRDTERAQDG